MTQVILKQLNPIVIEKLKRLAQSHQRTLEEEITSILEDVTENTPMVIPNNKEEMIKSLRGMASHSTFSSDEFARMKQEEIDWEERNQ